MGFMKGSLSKEKKQKKRNKSKNMLLYFFNYNFPLLWPSLLPFSIGFVATAPGKQ